MATLVPPLIARDWAVFLDIDGTLLDFAPTPDAVTMPSGLSATLTKLLEALDGALALVTGRSIADADRIFAPLRLPIAGQHGAETRRDRHEHARAPEASALPSLLAPIYVFAAKYPAIRIEDKGLSAAIHYRGAEATRDTLERLLHQALQHSQADFKLVPGHLVFDLVQRDATKGAAVAWFMRDRPFAGRRPLFIGDAGTDEDGFAAALAQGGHAVRVGVEGESLAPWRLPSPEAARDWLSRSVAALAQR